ncbi:unnamed protein product [Rotaria sordida]|uniref:N-acetyltransferase domain-containing protein n=1 Tax=Rotaria sordida TaxID=392033 RepID=A0A814KLG8_9BILA|nr:unnamed protein product [Rotaria sordida]CAF3743788.1 unnamed protein product [Rotaria sordida]
MNTTIANENTLTIKNSLQNSISGSFNSKNHIKCDNLSSARYTESLPIIKTDNEETTLIQSNLSRFPDIMDITNMIDENLDETNSRTKSMSSSEQENINELEDTKDLLQWNDALKKYEQKQEKIENFQEDEKVNNTPVLPTCLPSIEAIHVNVQEFKPISIDDPILLSLRNLFIRSFDEYYKQIEAQLNLKSDKTLKEWLDETFNDEKNSILSGTYRCFILCSDEYQDSKENVLGFLTLKDEGEGSIYIAQVAVRLDIKRRGYGVQLLQHLRQVYPPNTHYWGLCRRANRPALQFYLKNGAKFMNDDDVATKYGYDPTLYAGFEFLDTVSVIIPQLKTMVKIESDVNNSDQQLPTTPTQNNENPSLESNTEEKQESKKKNRTELVGCCIIS